MFSMAMAVAVGFLMISTSAQAQDNLAAAEKFYKGARVTIEAGPAGSGVDIGARLFAKYFEQSTGARVIVQNHSEVGGLKAINLTYRAKPDGLTIGCHTLSTVIQNQLLGEPAAMYELDKLIPIGSSLMAPMALWVNPDGAYGDLEKLRASKGLLQAGASKLGYMAFWGTLGGHLIGLDFKTVIGVGGPPAAKMSVMRGETHFTNIAVHTTGIAPDLRPVLFISLERHDLHPEVPTIHEVADLTAEQEDLLALAEIGGLYSGAGFVFPPGVAPDRMKYVQNVYRQITTSQEFIEESKKLFGVSGAHDAEKLTENIQFYIDNRDKLEEIRQLVTGYYL
ncbi:MAG: Bug family tripartite tricarboxylate transporter substrate binding protein [Desulfotignum sp.]